MKKIKYFIQDYFGFSPKETRGFIVLMLLLFPLLILPSLIKAFLPSDDTTVADQEKLDRIITQLESNTDNNQPSFASTHIEKKKFLFNPNEATAEDFISLGLNSRIAARIINYREKGGKFVIRSDFKKIYGISEEDFLGLYDYIDLPEKKESTVKTSPLTTKTKNDSFKKESKTLTSFDINTADTTQLIAVKGIGSKLAQRIISFRNKLGGFISQNQLSEVYGLDSSVVKTLNEITFISPGYQPTKIHLNTCSLEELKNHPYISFQLAKTIIAYREQHGAFNTITDLKRIHSVNSQTYSKIEDYLDL